MILIKRKLDIYLMFQGKVVMRNNGYKEICNELLEIVLLYKRMKLRLNVR